MANRRSNLTNAFETTLSAQMGSAAISMSLNSVVGLTVPFYLVIEPESVTQREYVYVDSLAASVANVAERYLSGSAAASGLTHPAGSVVRMAAFAQNVEDLHDRADDLQAQINAAGDHGGLSGLGDDDHSQYLNEARHDADDHSSITYDHGGATGLSDDDHTQYLKEKGQGGTAAEVPTHTHASAAEAGQFDHGNAAGLGDDDHSQYHNTARHDADDHSSLEDFWTYAVPGTLSTETGTIEFPVPFNMTIQSVKLRSATAPTGAALIVDINKGGTTVFSTRPQIAAAANAGGSGAVFSDATWDEDEYISIDIDQVGSTVEGSDLVIVIIYTRR